MKIIKDRLAMRQLEFEVDFVPMKFPYNVPTKFRNVLTFSGIFLPVYYYLDGTVAWMDKKYTYAECMFDENDERTWA